MALPTQPPASPPRTGPNRAERRGRSYATITEVAKYIGVTDRTVRQMVSDGRLTAYSCGRRLVRLDLNEVDAAMQPVGGAA